MGKPLLDVLRDVVLDPAEQAAFTTDPATYLAQYGYDDVAADDLSEAFGLVADTLPPDVAQAVAAAAPAPTLAVDDDDAFAVGEGEGATFGDVTGDFDAVALGGPDTVPDDDIDIDDADSADSADDPDPFDALEDDLPDDAQPPPDGDQAGGFGAGSVDAELTTDVQVETDWAEAEVPADDFGDDGLGGPDTFTDDVAADADDYGQGVHDDVDDLDDLDDGGLGDDPGDFLDDVGSF